MTRFAYVKIYKHGDAAELGGYSQQSFVCKLL